MDEEAHADYSHLPADVLREIFSLVFGNVFTTLQAARQWLSLRLTCRHWEEVLLSTPPALALHLTPAPEESLMRWLPTVPVRLLAAEYFSQPGEQPPDLEDESKAQQAERLLSVHDMLWGLEGIGAQPFWSLAAFQHLEELSIAYEGLAPPGQPLVFDAAPLQGLARLAGVRLGEFTGFRLAGLPPSVRHLELWYDDNNQFAMPELPQHLRLERFAVGKRDGVVGLCMEDVWGRCTEVALLAPQVLLGIPCAEQRVWTFERPYREGHYVPPHILGDMEQLERSQEAAASAVSDFFCGCARSGALKALTFAGGCAAVGVKFVPMREGNREALPFIFRSQPAGVGMVRDVNYLFSLRADELQEWARDWLIEQRELAEEGEAAFPGKGDMGATGVKLAWSGGGADVAATVVVWREGDAGPPPPYPAPAEEAGPR